MKEYNYNLIKDLIVYHSLASTVRMWKSACKIIVNLICLYGEGK